MSRPVSMTTRSCVRKRFLIAFTLVALTLASAVAAEGVPGHERAQQVVLADDEPVQTQGGIPVETKAQVGIPSEQQRQAAEAARAYKYAMSTLAAINAHASASSHYPSWVYSNSPTFTSTTNPLFSYFLPNLQGQGPIGSTLRAIVGLHHQFRDALLSIGFDTSGRPAKGKKGWDIDEELKSKAIKVVDLLEHAADLGHDKAKFALAQLHLFPPTKHFEFSPKTALSWLNTHVTETGNATSHGLLGFFYASGYKPFMEGQGRALVEPDQAMAQLHYTFAAHEGDKSAQMALGYRYWSGIGTVEDCKRALEWYEAASETAMRKFIAGPPGGRTLPQTPTRLSDLVGGVYGPGASVASTGQNIGRAAIKAGAARAAGETWEDLLEYYTFNADRGEVDFAYRLGKIFYHGSVYSSSGGIASGGEGVSSVPRDIPHARHYFLKIARQAWPRDPVDPSRYTSATAKEEEHDKLAGRSYASASAGYLGRMALRGEGVRADPAVARMWFERGALYGDRECHNGLGIIWRDGLVNGKVDMKKALIHFKTAAQNELAEAEVNLGKYYYSKGDLALATTYFELAMRHGSPFEAYYYLGLIYSAQANSPSISEPLAASSCAMAVSFHKIVSERGVWDDDLLRDAEIAWVEGTDRGKEVAMLKWWIAAERGHEIAQSNLAFILDQDKSVLRLTRFSPINPSNETARVALTHWSRAASQRNIDALVKVGDYYYHGLGVSDEVSKAARLEKAAKYYQSAVDTQVSALAMWNLGWMYENGVGVPQDFHLAKRHYDGAMETNTEAYIPILISLGKLYLKSIWHTLNGGENGLSLWELDENDLMYTDNAMVVDKQLDGSNKDSVPKRPAKEDEDVYGGSDEDDGIWYPGKAKEEFDRQRQQLENPGREVHEEDDPIQWARDRRNAEAEQDGDFGPEDDFEGALRAGRRGEEEDPYSETMLLVVLCVAVSVLLYVRTRLVERIRRQNGQAQPAAPNGVFPPPGDPARGEWMIAH